MHPRNRYKNNPPDFNILAYKYASFYPFVKYKINGEAYIDFKDPLAVQKLTYILLQHDFDLKLDIPLDTLCPMVKRLLQDSRSCSVDLNHILYLFENRLNYIHWLEDLISYTDDDDHGEVYGFDIGTGASCIYPLLGCTLNKHWKFVATDISERMINLAEANVERNNLQARITIILKSKESKLLLDANDETKNLNIQRFSFCMCNPPFYESQEQYEAGMMFKKKQSSATSTGSPEEIFTKGGEFGFIKQILDESLMLRERFSWYTSMIGRKETINKIIDNYVLTEFCQGQTRRWGIGWSFGIHRPPSNISQPSSRRLRKVGPSMTEFTTQWTIEINSLFEYLDTLFRALEIGGAWTTATNTFIGNAPTNTWSRTARRQRERAKAAQQSQQQMNMETDSEPLFEFQCHLEQAEARNGNNVNGSIAKMTMSWTSGNERSIFEAFYLHVKRRIEEKFGKSALRP
ncbi:5314_t:CDS:10 [Ambispora leptoticha]|uniref:U6 small nuclear RNA (adenine-(43)-N(6))-methyltransferase n=1 Tax=Ambispora leptoticha TaxID=144679 RepID=A0A9N8ZSG9_9GLOM|nr:5314_t:CDS:10 [Ambispora leptoticha]